MYFQNQGVWKKKKESPLAHEQTDPSFRQELQTTTTKPTIELFNVDRSSVFIQNLRQSFQDSISYFNQKTFI